MIKTGNPVISIYTEMTPNPETMKFVANKLLYPGKSIDFPDAESAKPSPLATELFGFPFIKAVFIASNFVTLTKTIETDWQDMIPSVRQFLKDYLEEGKLVVNEEELATVKQTSSNEVSADDDDVVKRIKELLDNYVRPAVDRLAVRALDDDLGLRRALDLHPGGHVHHHRVRETDLQVQLGAPAPAHGSPRRPETASSRSPW